MREEFVARDDMSAFDPMGSEVNNISYTLHAPYPSTQKPTARLSTCSSKPYIFKPLTTGLETFRIQHSLQKKIGNESTPSI